MNDKTTEWMLWARDVMSAEGLFLWTLEYSSGKCQGVVLYQSKTICVNFPQTEEPDWALTLHEVAHATLGRPGHDAHFADRYTDLVRRYLKPQ